MTVLKKLCNNSKFNETINKVSFYLIQNLKDLKNTSEFTQIYTAFIFYYIRSDNDFEIILNILKEKEICKNAKKLILKKLSIIKIYDE